MTPKAKATNEEDFAKPGALAIARDQAGGDLRAAVLLYRIKHFFDPEKKIKKLQRNGREWIAMPRDQWAFEAGLTRSEMVNYALPHLKKLPFVTIKQMRLSPNHPKTLWISLDLVGMHAATTPSDMIAHFPPGEKVLGDEGKIAYLYGKPKMSDL
jgi:hypothetical protein